MKSLEEVIEYKLNFLPKGTDPFYAFQRNILEDSKIFFDFYEMKNTIFSNDSFTLVEDITPLFIYILSCNIYHRENGYGKITTMEISLDIPNFRESSNHYYYYRKFCDYGTLNDVFDDLGENRIAIFKKRLNESFSRMGYCIRYIKPFTIRFCINFIYFSNFLKEYKTFKEDQCVICLEEEPKVLFCNCGHICICKKCISKRYHYCPLCKKENTNLRIIQ